MKRTLSLLLAFALLSGLLAACGEQPQPSPDPSAASTAPLYTPEASAGPVTPAQPSAALPEGPDVAELAETAFSASGCEDRSAVERLNAGEDAGSLAFYVENAYGLEEWEDAAVIRAAGASAFEIAVLHCAGEDAALRATQALTNYCVSREGDFTGYAPDQADMASKGIAAQKGDYAALFICPEASMACAAFSAVLDGKELPDTPEPAQSEAPEPVQTDNAFPNRVAFDPPNEDDMSLYDTAAIRTAWTAGSPDGLSDDDRAIYDAAKAVLDETVTDGMSDYEKEKAVYQWMVRNINYDWTHQNILLPTPRRSFTPYGGLVSHTAVCLGYATAFQLLMDLAGVECITVVGAAHYSTGDHAWNMVRLNGNWYCVDVTWDANWREQGASSGDPWEWNYFNVTSEVMADSDHQWDYVNTPEAVTEGNGA